jgi:hypothetical protein
MLPQPLLEFRAQVPIGSKVVGETIRHLPPLEDTSIAYPVVGIREGVAATVTAIIEVVGITIVTTVVAIAITVAVAIVVATAIAILIPHN